MFKVKPESRELAINALNLYIETLKNHNPLPLKKWNFNKLKRIQLFFPIIFYYFFFLVMVMVV